jgi:serine/threonine protein kinase
LEQKRVPQSVDLSYPQFVFNKNEDEIGRGGNAVVYRATVRDADLTIALKRPFPGKTVKKAVVRDILTEAENWERVDDHPYIATIVDWGNEAFPWIAVEYLSGGSVISQDKECSLAQRLWMAYAIVDAVAYASSQRGVIHRDLKPQNILLQQTPAGTWDVPKIVDWGLSRELIQHTGSISQATPEYAAPEQFDTLMPDTVVGPHTDVYQLGVLCYELVTGTYPDHLHRDLSPPSETSAEIPAAIDPIIMNALAHERTVRVEHPLLLRDNFEDVLEEILVDSVEAERARRQNRTEGPETVSRRRTQESEKETRTGETADTGAATAGTDADSVSETWSGQATDRASEDASWNPTGWFHPDHHPDEPERELSTAIRSVRTQPTDGSVAEILRRHRLDPIAVAIDSIERSSSQ